MNAVKARVVPPRLLPDHLLAHGESVIDLTEAAALVGLSPKATADAMVRLKRAGLVFSPTPGLYVAVPPEYRTWGAVPALDFIDPLMRAHGRGYYVALLSAAELHGAAHQRPQVFQVMVNSPLRDRSFGRVRLRFYSRRHLDDVPVTLVNSRVDRVRVSSPASTLLDLALRPGDGGGLSNVATVLYELVDEAGVTAESILDASRAYPTSSLRRAGWLLDHVGAELDRDLLAARLDASPRARATTLLDPRGARRGSTDDRWGLVVNAEVEPDL